MKFDSFYSCKLVVSGSVAELFHNSFRPDFKFSVYEDVRRMYSLERARSNLKRKINANAGMWYDKNKKKFFVPQFLTVTFKDNVQDLDFANHQFNLFIKRFNYQILGSKKSVLKFSVVVEFQERGAIHYHVVLYNVPFIADLKAMTEKCWGKGFCWYESIKDVKNVGAYMCKYLTKSSFDDRLLFRKSHFSSQGLYKSLKFTDPFQVSNWLSMFPDPSFSIENQGFLYQSYDLSSELKYLFNYRALAPGGVVESK